MHTGSLPPVEPIHDVKFPRVCDTDERRGRRRRCRLRLAPGDLDPDMIPTGRLDAQGAEIKQRPVKASVEIGSGGDRIGTAQPRSCSRASPSSRYRHPVRRRWGCRRHITLPWQRCIRWGPASGSGWPPLSGVPGHGPCEPEGTAGQRFWARGRQSSAMAFWDRLRSRWPLRVVGNAGKRGMREMSGLRGVSLRGVCLRGVCLRGVCLRGVCLRGVLSARCVSARCVSCEVCVCEVLCLRGVCLRDVCLFREGKGSRRP